jgi:hypothetical protein
MRALGTTAAFGRVERLEQASFTPQMEDSRNAARAVAYFKKPASRPRQDGSQARTGVIVLTYGQL